jgi:hypothetical protein
MTPRPVVHECPETSSDERAHILDFDCWCAIRVTVEPDRIVAQHRHEQAAVVS